MSTELAKAYVQIVPSAKGISGSIKGVLDPEAESAGESSGARLGNSLVGKLKGIISVAAIGAALAKSITEGADMQQAIGGIETMFKDSASTMISYANNAYKTTGQSATQYMEQVTGFSASLLQSLGGDTAKAAKVANMAMIDMSDNANKFGTDMESIQYAYQGFAKQNYTMLDNLKLGYGGTKAEMERLLADAQKLSGVKYDINNLSDVYNAIHVIQSELGITGTTAKEAELTFTGSFNAMKAAANNLWATLSLGDQASMSLTEALTGLASSASNFILNNAVPMLLNAVSGLVDAIKIGVETGGFSKFGEMIMNLMMQIGTFIIQNAPLLVIYGIAAIGQFAQGLINGIPKVISAAWNAIKSFAQTILSKLSELNDAAQQTIEHFVTEIRGKFSDIMSTAWEAVKTFCSGIVNKLSSVGEKGREIVEKLKTGITSFFPNLLASIPGLMNSLVNKISSAVGKIRDVGRNFVQGLWNGIASVKDWIISKIGGFTDSIVSSIKSFFGIHSPSRLMRDEVGKMLSLGIGEGFSEEMNSVINDMESSLPTTFEVAPAVRYNTTLSDIAAGDVAFKEPDIMDIVMNILRSLTIKHVTELDGKVIAEDIYKLIDELLGNDSRLQMRGV